MSAPSRAAEWLWVGLAFLAANIVFSSTQPVHPREGLGEGGQIYHAMAKAMPRELVPQGPAPYVRRPGLPFAAAAVAKSQDWVITAGFERLNLFFNVLSTILLAVLLRRYVDNALARMAVIVAFMLEPHSPVRLSYVHPLATDAVVLAMMLAGLVAIDWFQARPCPRRASWVAALVAGGVIFHESALIIAVCLIAGSLLQPPGPAQWWERLRALDETAAWLPLVGGAAMLALLHALVEPAPSHYSLLAEVTQSVQDWSLSRYGLSWFLVFGPFLALPLYFWRSSAGFLRDQPALLIYLVICSAWAWIGGGQAERFLAAASPVVYLLIARSLAGAGVRAGSVATTGLAAVQGISLRVFSPIGPIEPPVVLGEVWERLGSPNVAWALSYQNLWGQLFAPELQPVYLLWYGLTGGAVLAFLWHRDRDLTRWAGLLREPVARLADLKARTWRPGSAAQTRILVGLGTAAVMAPVVWLALSRFYWTHYAEPGVGYLAYNLARIWLVGVLLLAFLSTGSRIVEYGRLALTAPRRWWDHFVETAFTGAAAWSVLVVGLAASHLYYAWVLLPAVTLAVAAAIFDLVASPPAEGARAAASDRGRWSLVGLGLRFGVAVNAAAILLAIALWGHYGGDNDVPGNYLPYYDTVLRNHSIEPNAYWVHFFASKGHGLGLLANVLSDVNGAALATFLVLLMGAAMIPRLAGTSVSSASAIALIGVCLYLQYYAAQGAYAKSHVIRNTLILYLILFRVMTMCVPAAGVATTLLPGLVVMTAVIVLSPLAAVLLLPVILGGGALLMLSGHRVEGRRSLAEASWVIAVTLGVCLYNYLQVGVPELHDMPSFVGGFVDLDRFSQWIDPDLAYVDYRLGFLKVALPGGAASNAAVSMAPVQSLADAMPGLFSMPVWIFLGGSLAIGLTAAAWFRSRPSGGAPVIGRICAIVYLFLVLAVVAVLRAWGGSGPGSSMGRFTDFAVPVGIALGIVILGLAWAQQVGVVASRVRAIAVLTTAAAAIGFGAAPVWALPWRSSTAFLVGRTSYAAMNEGGWDTATAYRVARLLPATVRVEMVNFLPGFTAIPDTPFQRPDGCVYLKDYTRVIYGSADEAAAILRGVDVNYFLFDVSKDAPVTWSGLAPLFALDSISSRMQLIGEVRSANRDLYVLTWRQHDTLTDDRFTGFLAKWRDKLAWEKSNGYFHGSYDEGARLIGLRH